MRSLIFIILFYLFALTATGQVEGLYEIKADTTLNVDGLTNLDELVKDKRVVITGENHSFFSSNQILKLKMTLYLYDKGFRYFLLELGAGIGYLANDYATTGNVKSLETLNTGRNMDKNPINELLEVLWRFNKGKSYEDMIKIQGVDYTRYPFFSTRAMANIIEDLGCEKELSTYYEDLQVLSSARDNADKLGFSSLGKRVDEDFDIKASFKTYRNRLFELSIRNLIQDFYRDTTKFQNALGDKYEVFKFILDEINETLEWYKGEGLSIQSHIRRERHLENRILQIFESDTLAKVFGQFGRCHIRGEDFEQDCYAFDMISVSNRLEKHEFLKNKVLIIPIFYRGNREVEVNKSNTKVAENDLIKRGKLFLYDRDKELLSFKSDTILPKYIIVNTFSRLMSINQLLEDEVDVKYDKKGNDYRGKYDELYFLANTHFSPLSNDIINQQFGAEIFPAFHEHFGAGLQYVGSNGIQMTFKTAGILPTRNQTDSVRFRYSNWRFEFGLGYNIVYRKKFSFYTDLNMLFGFSKIREERVLESPSFTFPVASEEINYRNSYFGLIGDIGIKYKLPFITFFLEGGYQLDVSNDKWRSNGFEVQGLSPQRFSGIVITSGIAFPIE